MEMYEIRLPNETALNFQFIWFKFIKITLTRRQKERTTEKRDRKMINSQSRARGVCKLEKGCGHRHEQRREVGTVRALQRRHGAVPAPATLRGVSRMALSTPPCLPSPVVTSQMPWEVAGPAQTELI